MEPGPGPGHYTILGAKGDGADLYWTESGTWVTDQSQAYIFGSVQEANKTPILGLPATYSPVIIQTTIDLPSPLPSGSNPC